MINTVFLLMARHNAQPVIDLEVVRKDYFSHLHMTQFVTKLNKGEIPLPVVRPDPSNKSAKGVALAALADYLDSRIEAANKERAQLAR